MVRFYENSLNADIQCGEITFFFGGGCPNVNIAMNSSVVLITFDSEIDLQLAHKLTIRVQNQKKILVRTKEVRLKKTLLNLINACILY